MEACPTDAITHGHGFELASLNATGMVMRKEDLLVPMLNSASSYAEKDEAESSPRFESGVSGEPSGLAVLR